MKSIADFILNASFCQLLVKIDMELKDGVQETGCTRPGCGGAKLDQANYRRKIDSTTIASSESFELAFSLCCRNCRHRARLPLLFGGFVVRWLRSNLNKKNRALHWIEILKLFAELNQELVTICDARPPPAENEC
jgi:hypothetical protein